MNDWRRFEKVLRENGYERMRVHGSHYIFSNGEKTLAINRDLNRIVAKRLIKENNLTANEYLRQYEMFTLKTAEKILETAYCSEENYIVIDNLLF